MSEQVNENLRGVVVLIEIPFFFFTSGLLTCFVFLRHYEKMNLKISFRLMLKYYVHRIWRLSPPYFICLLISANLSPYFGIGPLYPPEGIYFILIKS